MEVTVEDTLKAKPDYYEYYVRITPWMTKKYLLL
jgi:hypothetical protein